MSQKKQNFGEPIDRLLRSYEVTMQFLSFVIEIFTKGQTGQFVDPFWNRILNGPVKHWQSIRNALLKVHTDGFDVEKYVGPTHDIHPQNMEEFEFAQSRLMAMRVAEWTKSSRRVYRVPKDLQLLLAATSLEDVDWSMIKWPFDSLLISLEEPLVLRGKTIDAILIAKEIVYGHEVIAIETIATDLPTMESVFIGDQRSRIEKAIQKGDKASLDYAKEKLASAVKNRMNGGGEIWLTKKACFEPGGLASRFEGLDLGEADETSASKVVFRIVFGLMLYLQSRPTTELIPKGWESSTFERQEGPSRLIRLASEVCVVKSIYSLTSAEREALKPILRGGFVDVAPHHREGHWRRPPGKGDDPNHPKTVWVRPTIVRRDKLADGGLPLGSTEVV